MYFDYEKRYKTEKIRNGGNMKINRNYYLNQLIEKQNNGLVMIISGIRRCGKSYLLVAMFKNHLIDVHKL